MPRMNLQTLAKEYHYFLLTPDDNGFTQVFNVDRCEVCGCEVEGPNGVGVSSTPSELAMVGMIGRNEKPIDGGYSELHQAATCTDCCYASDAKQKKPAVIKSDEPDPSKFYEWTVKIRVNAVWVADGFDLTADRLHRMVNHDLDYARMDEIETEIVVAPDEEEVAQEQGYKNAEQRAARNR